MPAAIKLTFAAEAADDLRVAYAWYESNRPGLGEEFLRCVEACVNNLRRAPESNLKIHQDFRRALVRRFPYAIFYEYAKRKVIVYGVLHTSRNPEKWRNRFV